MLLLLTPSHHPGLQGGGMERHAVSERNNQQRIQDSSRAPAAYAAAAAQHRSTGCPPRCKPARAPFCLLSAISSRST